MTRKDYVLLATAIGQAYAEAKTAEAQKTVESVMEHIGHALQYDNPNFKPHVFVAAVKKASQ